MGLTNQTEIIFSRQIGIMCISLGYKNYQYDKLDNNEFLFRIREFEVIKGQKIDYISLDNLFHFYNLELTESWFKQLYCKRISSYVNLTGNVTEYYNLQNLL